MDKRKVSLGGCPLRAAIAALVLRALSKDPAGRPQSVTEMYAALDAVAG
ncbi:MAG: hypothetical protein ABSG61_11220 [Gemmatimonadales bacterium]|jgi:hypothetical protein